MIGLGVARANVVPINAAADAVPTVAVGDSLNIAANPWAPVPDAATDELPHVYKTSVSLKPSPTTPPGSVVTDPTTNGLLDGIKLDQSCHYTTKCINPDEPRPAPPPPSAGYNCTYEGGGQKRCLVEEELYPMQVALRGFSQRPAGARTTFAVEREAVVHWEYGVRYGYGSFSAEGVVERGKTAGTEETWPLRGDCWEPADPGDDFASCDGVGGSRAATGTDPWVWQRWLREICNPGCSATYYEVLRQKAWGGGTQSGLSENLYYYERPSAIRAGAYGVPSAYPPGSSVKRFTLESQRSYIGATFNINPSGSFGRGSFSANMTNKTLERVVNRVEFRNDIDWIAAWYRYDGGVDSQPWEREFFSCEFAPGWGGSPCWTYGS